MLQLTQTGQTASTVVSCGLNTAFCRLFLPRHPRGKTGMPLLVCQAARCSVYRAISTFRPSLRSSTPASVFSCSRSQGCLISQVPSPVGLAQRGSHSRFGSFVTAARAKDDLLKGVDPEYREDIARILDLADQAQATWTTVFTGDFLSFASPLDQAACNAVTSQCCT